MTRDWRDIVLMDDRILRALSRRNIRFFNDITLVSPLSSGLGYSGRRKEYLE